MSARERLVAALVALEDEHKPAGRTVCGCGVDVASWSGHIEDVRARFVMEYAAEVMGRVATEIAAHPGDSGRTAREGYEHSARIVREWADLAAKEAR